MKYTLYRSLLFIFLILFFMFGINFSNKEVSGLTISFPKNKTNILIISSYSDTDIISKTQIRSFARKLNDRYQIFVYYLNWSNNLVDINDLERFYKEINPEYVYVVGDSVYQYFIIYRRIYRDKIIFFSNVYDTLDKVLQSESNRHPVIGIKPVTNLSMLYNFFSVAKFIPDRIIFFYDNTYNSSMITTYWTRYTGLNGFRYKVVKINSFEDLKKYSKNVCKDDLIIANLNYIKDEYNHYTDSTYILKYLDELFPDNIIITRDSELVKYGATIAYGMSCEEIGKTIAKFVIQIDEKNITIDRDTILTSKPSINLNLDSLKKLHITLTQFDMGRFEIHVY